MAKLIAGFDIGGTKISLRVADRSATTLYEATIPTDPTTGAALLIGDRYVYDGLSEQLVTMLKAALREIDHTSVSAIGLVSAGPIRNGGLWDTPNIVPPGIARTQNGPSCFMPLVDPLRAAFACPCLLYTSPSPRD